MAGSIFRDLNIPVAARRPAEWLVKAVSGAAGGAAGGTGAQRQPRCRGGEIAQPPHTRRGRQKRATSRCKL